MTDDALEGESQGRFKVLHTYALHLAFMLSLGPVICYFTLTKLIGKEIISNKDYVFHSKIILTIYFSWGSLKISIVKFIWEFYWYIR